MNPGGQYDVAKFTDRELRDEIADVPRLGRSAAYLAALEAERERRAWAPWEADRPPLTLQVPASSSRTARGPQNGE